MSQRIDVHQEITNRIIEAIEKGAGKFQLPWHRPAASLERPVNIQSGKRYRGINVVTLWVEAQLKNYSAPVWGTYKQFQEQGCQVRRGEKASLIVFYKELEFARDDAGVGEDDTHLPESKRKPSLNSCGAAQSKSMHTQAPAKRRTSVRPACYRRCDTHLR